MRGVACEDCGASLAEVVLGTHPADMLPASRQSAQTHFPSIWQIIYKVGFDTFPLPISEPVVYL